MTPQEKELLEAVAAIKQERTEKRQIPTHSLLVWVIPRLQPQNRAKCLENARRLEKAGRLKIGKTINDTYLELLEEPQATEQATLFPVQETE